MQISPSQPYQDCNNQKSPTISSTPTPADYTDTSLHVALHPTTIQEATSASPSYNGAWFMMVSGAARLILATSVRASSLTCPRVWQARVSASSSSASTTSSESTPSVALLRLCLSRPHHRLLLCVLGSGKTGVCLRP